MNMKVLNFQGKQSDGVVWDLNRMSQLLVLLFSTMLVSCGGGGGSGNVVSDDNNDVTPPSVAAPADVSVEAESAAGTSASTATITTFLVSSDAVDAVDSAPVLAHDAPEIFPLGATVVSFSYTDIAGNVGTSSASVTVVDTTPPLVSAPTNLTVESVSSAGTTANLANLTTFLAGSSAVDAVDGAPALSHNAPVTFPLGDTLVVFSYTDYSGNVGSDSGTVTVKDTSAPVVTAPLDISVEATSSNGVASTETNITAFLTSSTAVDSVDSSPVLTHDAPTTFPLGVTGVTFAYTDSSGNVGNASAIVVVADTIAPVITLVGADPLTVDLNSIFSDPGSIVFDTVDTGLVAAVSGTVDISTVGTYLLSYDVSDIAGNSATTVTRTVNVETVVVAKIWQGATLVETTDDEAAHPRAVFDNFGNIMAVWRHKEESGSNDIYRVFASRYNGTSWSASTLVSNDTTDTWDDAYDSYLSFDTVSSNILAVWQQTHKPSSAAYSEDSIWLREFNGTSWGASEVIENGTDYCENPQIAVDATGKRMVVWGEQSNDVWGIGFVRANLYNGSAWTGEELISDGINSLWAEEPQLAMNAAGKGVVVWSQESANYNVYANVHNGSSWGSYELLESSVEHAFTPHVVIDSSGNAMAVWSQTEGTQYDIWARRHNGTSWGTAVIIDSGSGNAYTPKVASDSSGNIFAIWEQHDGTEWNIYLNLYDGSSWGTPELLVAAVSTGAGTSSQNRDALNVAVDTDDNVIIIWRQYDVSAWNAYANIFDGNAWSGAELLSSAAGDVDDAQLVVDGNGNAVAIWDQDDGFVRSVWANILK